MCAYNRPFAGRRSGLIIATFPFPFSNNQICNQPKFSNKKTASRLATIQTLVRASRRDAPESLKAYRPEEPGEAREGVRDAGCLMHPQPCAQKRAARPRTSIHSGGTGKPGNPARNGVTAYAVLSSGRCSIAPVLPRKMVCHTRLGGRASARITPASGAGPHGLPVRFSIVRPAPSFVSSQAQLNGRLPCQLRSRPIPPRPSHLIPRL